MGVEFPTHKFGTACEINPCQNLLVPKNTRCKNPPPPRAMRQSPMQIGGPFVCNGASPPKLEVVLIRKDMVREAGKRDHIAVCTINQKLCFQACILCVRDVTQCCWSLSLMKQSAIVNLPRPFPFTVLGKTLCGACWLQQWSGRQGKHSSCEQRDNCPTLTWQE